MATSPAHPALAERLHQHVAALARQPRVPGTPEHDTAAAYIRTQLQQAGFATEDVWLPPAEVKRYRRTLAGLVRTLKNPWLLWHPLRGCNVLTVPEPDQPELPLLVVGAHYDTVPQSPGADDNASAVAALLELGRHLRVHLDAAEPAACRLQLAAYDMEEYGMLGSVDHARALHRTGTAVRGMIALEMLGYADQRPGSQRLPRFVADRFSNVANFIGLLSNEASHGMLDVMKEALQTVGELPVESLVVPGRGEWLPVVRRSDHSSFWDCGFPAIMITDTSFLRNPHYHRRSDTPETLDYEFLAKVTNGLCAAVWQQLTAETV